MDVNNMVEASTLRAAEEAKLQLPPHCPTKRQGHPVRRPLRYPLFIPHSNCGIDGRGAARRQVGGHECRAGQHQRNHNKG